MKAFGDKFFYFGGDVRLGNANVATGASAAEGRALARALNQAVARHCEVPSSSERELRALSPTPAERRLMNLTECAVRRVLDTGDGL